MRFAVAVAALSLLTPFSLCVAQTFPPAVVTNSLSIGNGVSEVSHIPGTISNSFSDGLGAGEATVTATFSGGAAIGSVSASQSGLLRPGTSGNADVTFSYEVVGPSNPVVTLDFDVTATTEVTGGGGAAVLVNLYTNRFGACIGPLCTGILVGAPSSLSGTFFQSVRANTVATADFDAQCGFASLATGTCSASFDPMVTIDPNFGLSGYSLILSPDLSPPPVPEPETYALMLVGLGCLPLFLAGLRRGHRRPVAAKRPLAGVGARAAARCADLVDELHLQVRDVGVGKRPLICESAATLPMKSSRPKR
jgi:hypothetical protein